MPGYSLIGRLATLDSSSVMCPLNPGSMKPAVEWVSSPSRPRELLPSSRPARSSGSVTTSRVEPRTNSPGCSTNGSSPSGSTTVVRSSCWIAGSMCVYRELLKTRKIRSSRTSTLDGCTNAGSHGSTASRPVSTSVRMSRSLNNMAPRLSFTRPRLVLAAGLSRFAQHRPGIGDRTDVRKLVRVDDRTDGLDLPVVDVEAPRVDDLAVPVTEDRTGLAVHPVRLHHAPGRDERCGKRGEEAGHVLGADDAFGELWGLPAAVADELDVGGEQAAQAIDVALPQRGQESFGELLTLLPVGLEAGTTRVHVAARPGRKLAARRFRASDGCGDLGVSEPEDLAQHENGPLQRTEPFEQQQCRH